MAIQSYDVFVNDSPIGKRSAAEIKKIAADNTICFLWRNEAEEGPYSSSQLRSMWEQGKVTPDCYFKRPDESEWHPIADLWHQWFFTDSRSATEDLQSQILAEQKRTRKLIKIIVAFIVIVFLVSALRGCLG
jgi:hypothetical protein